MEERQKRTTAGSLLEQAANSEMKIVAARRAQGSGFEATGVGGRSLTAWSPKYEAVYEITERALQAALDPGKPEDVEKATEFVGRRAVVTREAVRDTVVLPLRQQTADATSKVIATGVARLQARNAEAACHAIVRRVYEEHEHLGTRVESGIAQTLTSARLLEGIDQAVHDAEAGLATLASALRRLEGRAEAEPARIDRDLAASRDAVRQAEDRLRVVARETQRTRLFGVERAVAQVVREVQVNIPRLTDERLAQVYLPLVRERVPEVERALRDRSERAEKRLEVIRKANERLRAIRGEEMTRLSGRGRVRLVGAPTTEAAQRAAIEHVVDAVYAGVARNLRDLLAWKAPLERMLEEVLSLVRERVETQAPVPSIDEVMLQDKDPAKVALELDRLIRESEVPVALSPGADHARLRDWRCRIIRVPAGSRLAQAMIDHAGYRSDAFAWTGRPDRLETILLQPGITLRETRLFDGDDSAYRSERADPAAPPIETLSDGVLAALVPRTATTPSKKAPHVRGTRNGAGRRVLANVVP